MGRYGSYSDLFSAKDGNFGQVDEAAIIKVFDVFEYPEF
jgi:hypothetical protein